MKSPARLARGGWLPLAVVALGFGLRAWRFGELGLEHYDEGVYALSARALSGAGGSLFRDQQLFSPPLHFGLAGLLARLSGVAVDVAALGLNVALGTLNVAQVGWIGSRWFGRAAGWSAAALLACSEYHIGLSRCGLTDMAFAVLFTQALFAVVEALRSGRWLHAVLAGLCVGLAWNTKYHGWLAAAVAGLAALPWLLRERVPLLRAVRTLAVVTLVACLVYLPWALFVESQPGGYAALAEYQRGMLRPGWAANLVDQVQFQVLLDGPVSRAGCCAALAVAWLAAGRGGGTLAVAMALAMATFAGLLGAPIVSVALAGVAALVILRRERGLPALALVAWMLVWLVLTPLYRPYARLVLPAVVAVALAAGWRLAALAARSREGGFAGPVAAALGAAALLALGRGETPTGDPWRPSDGLRAAARSMEADIPAVARVYVLGEPALAFYLAQAGRRAQGDAQGSELPDLLADEREPVWVVTGRYARSSGAEELLIERLGARLGAERRFDFVPKDLRVLDDNDPWNAWDFRQRPDDRYALGLRRVAPAD